MGPAMRAFGVAITLLALTQTQLSSAKTKFELSIEDKSKHGLKALYVARGSSSCWGIPGLDPLLDGRWVVTPDETNTACPAHGKDYDYYGILIIGLNYDFTWDFMHKFEEQAGQIKFQGLAKNVSGTLKWEYSCFSISPYRPSSYAVSCKERPPSSTDFQKGFTITIENNKTTTAVVV